jgi:Flp pilus assembly protein TadB
MCLVQRGQQPVPHQAAWGHTFTLHWLQRGHHSAHLQRQQQHLQACPLTHQQQGHLPFLLLLLLLLLLVVVVLLLLLVVAVVVVLTHPQTSWLACRWAWAPSRQSDMLGSSLQPACPEHTF